MPSPWVNISFAVILSMYTMLLMVNSQGLSSTYMETHKKQMKISYLKLFW